MQLIICSSLEVFIDVTKHDVSFSLSLFSKCFKKDNIGQFLTNKYFWKLINVKNLKLI